MTAVAEAQFDHLGLLDLDGTFLTADSAQLPRSSLTASAFQHHRPGRLINAVHTALITLLDNETPAVPPKSSHVVGIPRQPAGRPGWPPSPTETS